MPRLSLTLVFVAAVVGRATREEAEELFRDALADVPPPRGRAARRARARRPDCVRP